MTDRYCYDSLYRLTAVDPADCTIASPNQTYTYDANGNRLAKNATTYMYDAADRMKAAGGVSYGYYNTGNQASRGADTFNYDYENRLTSATISGVASSSAYNGDGLRMSHTLGATTTNYTWDVAAPLPVVLQDGTNTYVYGLDLISATDGAGAQTYFLHDGLGSTVNLTDSSGNVTGTYDYDVFGATLSGPAANPWQFTGEQRDADSGLYYLRARYHDPSTGRFLTQDPLRGSVLTPQTLNPYPYASNNPASRADPTGRDSEGLTGECISFGAALALFAIVTVLGLFSPGAAIAASLAFGAATTATYYALGNDKTADTSGARTGLSGILFFLKGVFGERSQGAYYESPRGLGSAPGYALLGLNLLYLFESGYLCLGSEQ